MMKMIACSTLRVRNGFLQDENQLQEVAVQCEEVVEDPAILMLDSLIGYNSYLG